jgi:hypothetical protein
MNATTCLCHPCQGFGRNENEFALELANIKPYDEKVNFEAKFHITQHHKSTNELPPKLYCPKMEYLFFLRFKGSPSFYKGFDQTFTDIRAISRNHHF